VVRLLGEGGMGMVYEAIDREAERSIAIKTLLQTNPASVFRFKQEFRTLADVQHPNLVQLYELVATEAGEVFFTMELVHGTNFVRYVRDEHGRVDHQRLREALTQLVEGISALHAAGKLHRDIKPSNILVTPEGRVVVLDFGVAAELSTSSSHPSSEAEIVGTARFMAPEQALMAAPHPAFDWYSVGVVLYYVLTGSFPFSGSPEEIVEQKRLADPVPPGERAPDVPPDLAALCMALLARIPEHRPTGATILGHLGASRGALSRAQKAVRTLVGREAHLRVLHEAAQATRSGGQLAVFVGGLSGMGKSALIRKFLDEQVEQRDALVLRGRAYERESVPFKAVDAIVDALSAHMKRAAKQHTPIPLPDDIALVAQIFPVLGRVPGVTSASRDVALEPTRVRRRAFVALRELIASAAGDRELIIYIDDAQWGDADSAALLLELLRSPTAARLLLITSYRQNEASNSAFLGELRARLPKNVHSRELEVGPLALDDAERLAFELLGAEQRSRAAAHSVARESGGCPFLIEELASSFVFDTHGQATAGATDLANVTLEHMVSERSRRLPDGARRMLEIVAIEGRPVPVTLAAAAARTQECAEEIIRSLCSHRFVRTGLRDGRETIEMSHDRIRETVAAQTSAALTRAHHAELARVFEATADENPEPMVVHLFGAGQTERGARFAEVAADQALEKLAFDRAAQLFRLANAPVSASSSDGRRLRLRLAQVLEWAGRGAEAAHIYEEVARESPSEERTALERAAAEHLLTCGRIDEGAAVLHRVLSAVGLSAPHNAVGAVAWLLAYRLWLRARGLGFRGRAAAELSQADRLRLDALFTVSLGFGSVDVVLSACMTARYLLAALKAGERSAITRAASLQMSLASAEGGVEGRQELELERTARRLVDQDPTPEAVAFFRSNIGISHYCRGRWRSAVRELDSVLEEFPAHRAGMTSNAKVFLVCSLVYAGRLHELRQRLPRLVTEAEDRGDLFMLAHIRASHPVVAWLAADDTDDARRHVREGMVRWPRLRFVIQHWQAMLAEAQIDLYAGDGASAYDRIARDMPDLRRSLLLQAQIIRGLTFFVHGRAAVASIASNPALREARLSEATRLARRLGRERMAWTSLLSSLLYGAIANARGDAQAAVASLRTSIETAKRAEMSMHGAAAVRQLGLLLGGEEGAQHIAEADAAMEAEDIRAPERWATMLLPGRWRPA
jgi:predicted Ser/Thr protein kinase